MDPLGSVLFNISINIFYNIYDLSLFISVRAFLPSLKVLKISQEKEEIIKMVSVIREINKDGTWLSQKSFKKIEFSLNL